MSYFKTEEFDDPTSPGTGKLMDPQLVAILESIRGSCNFPFLITSGYRTHAHNLEVGGVVDSEHCTGNAVDVHCTDGARRLLIVTWAIKWGIKRIGVKKDCVHLGNSPSLPQNVLWTYDK